MKISNEKLYYLCNYGYTTPIDTFLRQTRGLYARNVIRRATKHDAFRFGHLSSRFCS